MIKVKVVFFASFKEHLGCSELDLSLEEQTDIRQLCNQLTNKGELWEELFKDAKAKVKFACNQEMVELNHCLNEGDEIAFFPPVTGG